MVIPKLNPTPSGVKLKPAKAKPSGSLNRPLTPPPTLTREEIAALTGSMPFPIQDTPPPANSQANTLPIDSAEHLAALFAPSRRAAPAHIVAPVVAPVVAPQVAPVVSRAADQPKSSVEHPWVDHSLEQTATPWQPGDENRYQSTVAPERESEGPLGWLVPVVAIAAAVALAAVL